MLCVPNPKASRVTVRIIGNGLNVMSRGLKLGLVGLALLVSACGGGDSSAGGTGSPSAPSPPAPPPGAPNQPPIANAGPDQNVSVGATVTLAGSGTDPDGTIASFLWAQTAGPTVTLAGSRTATATFTAPAVTQVTALTFTLTVTDNLGTSATDIVVVSVSPVVQTSAVSTTTAIVEWSPVQGAVDYRVRRNGTQIALLEDIQLRFHDMDLTPGTNYSYDIEAINASGGVISSQAIQRSTGSGPANLTDADLPPANAPRSRAYTTFGWTPDPRYDTCSKNLHDAFWTFGPDNKVYPTWHPPIYEFADGTTCRFGHEHGQDPRPSNLYRTVGAMPFGYVNEQLSPNDPAFQRNEDHVAHKVAMFNGLEATDTNDPARPVLACDVLFKLHQGSHSPDAFRNNVHERFLNYQCSNGLEARWKGLQPFGSANQFQESIDNLFSSLIATQGASLPPCVNFQSVNCFPQGSDRRVIPTVRTITTPNPNFSGATESDVSISNVDGTRSCDNCQPMNGFAAYVPQWSIEVWQGGPTTGLVGANGLAYGFGGGPYWHVWNPSRYYDPNGNSDPANRTSYLLGRQIDQCYVSGTQGFTSRDCQIARARNGGQRIPFDSPLSPFKGTIRFNEVNFISIFNPDPANRRVYFDPYGRPQPSGPTQGGASSSISDVSHVRTAALPIRIYTSNTPNGRTTPYSITMANFAGSQQVGGPFGHGRVFTDFNFYRLKNGQTVDAGIHVPN